ncbi:ADP-ribosyl-(dinitrogen reductase) hydrolase [Magnetococcus marinus MC-1]|uniref:ADP-ribosyl-(Dinitrogen reductase) hydrolase n=1 Tax=Magnetococcus marinus (strain ATCC BAA-1437 / JCM 17883 / MC-1) TaxID=156889 RepID=A0L6X8_MAGMM|nr:ADP-ribosyl-[dinitrogen reductase] hydrolase [Magnetococcus marinus]ABK43721.1 ADP-ribosyl-(dinitrogen reductase) hydrolase [Magnetococcus marinus MC-1]
MLWSRNVTSRLAATEIEARAVAAYWGMAMGDALGATVEFMMPAEIKAKYGRHDQIIGGGWLHLKKGQVTDDTTMALALGEAILERSGKFDPIAIGDAFDRWMQSKPVDCGNTVRRGIVHFRQHRQSGQVMVPEGEFDGGNGTCMRTLPLALATLGMADEEMVQASRMQSHITHNHPLADAGTECINRMLHIALHGGSLADMSTGPVQRLINEHKTFTYRRKREPSNPDGFIVDTLRAVFFSLFSTDSFESCLIDVVNRGGDADTTGAIAGMVAGALYGLPGLPKAWFKALDAEVVRACEAQAVALIRTNTVLQAKVA